MAERTAESQTTRIRRLNDHARRTFTGAAVMVTASFHSLGTHQKSRVLERVRRFDSFETGNDPYHEHDMAFFEEGGMRFFFKFDYYDPTMHFASDDPADEVRTRRVLTIGLAGDY